MPPPSIKPKKPSQIDDLVSTFSNTLNALPSQKHIQELSSRISAEDYFATTFKWSRIVNKHLKYASQEIWQYKGHTTKFEEPKHLYY